MDRNFDVNREYWSSSLALDVRVGDGADDGQTMKGRGRRVGGRRGEGRRGEGCTRLYGAHEFAICHRWFIHNLHLIIYTPNHFLISPSNYTRELSPSLSHLSLACVVCVH